MFAPVLDKFPSLADDEGLCDLFYRADQLGIRMEVGDSGLIWEAAPGVRHQRLMFAIATSIQPQSGSEGPCECIQIQDLAVRLPDGLVKRPDVSVFCQMPNEMEGFVHSVPKAVVEITSPGSEDKDLIDGPNIYLRNGVEDILVLDRRTDEVHHWTASTHRILPSPQTFTLQCGCTVTV